MITKRGSMKQSRKQLRARRPHKCDLCGKPIVKGCEYIAESRQGPTGWVDIKRHIHCDAILKFCAEKMRTDGANLTAIEMREFVNHLCDTECMQGWRHRCGNDGFSCPQLLYVLRHRPGYRAALKSAQDNEKGDEA